METNGRQLRSRLSSEWCSGLNCEVKDNVKVTEYSINSTQECLTCPEIVS